MKFEDYRRIIGELIDDIEKRKGSFLVGAGVSMLLPSSLPSGVELKNLALFEFLKHPTLSDYSDKISNHDKYKSIVPEIIFQRMHEALGEDLFPFFDVLKTANTNLAHKTLAFLADRYDIKILTTNFDLLIEKHISIKIENIIHLHGSLNDHSQMMIRINQVGRGLDSNLKKIAIDEFNGKNLYVCGYSGNDKDIIDTINSCNPRKINWIVRSKNDSFVLSNIKRLHPRLDINIVECDLIDLFQDLEVHFYGNKQNLAVAVNPKKLITDRLVYLQTISKKINLSKIYACYGKVLFDLGEYKTASDVYINAVKSNLCKGIHNKYWFYVEAANCKRIIGEFNKGINYLTSVINNHNSVNYLSILSASYNVYGLIILEKDNPEPFDAVKYFSKAIDTIDKFSKTTEGSKWEEGIKIFQGKIYNNLGLAFENANDFSSSLINYKKSLNIKKINGDLIGISQTSANIAILYYKLEKHKRSYYWKKTVVNIADKYQLFYQKAYLFRRIGSISCEQGRTKYGLKLLQEALDILTNLEGADFDIKLTETAINKYRN